MEIIFSLKVNFACCFSHEESDTHIIHLLTTAQLTK